MIIKQRDSNQGAMEELLSLLKEELTPTQRFLIERELRNIRKGAQGEKNSAYYIDFHFANSKNWAVIHDLRLEHEGQSAQIDHLLIVRYLDIYVLESKNFSYELEINSEGEFQLFNGKYSVGIPSPIEQNKRHIIFLESFFLKNKISPTRLGIALQPRFKSYVLVSPKSIIKRPPKSKFDTHEVIKADALRTKLTEELKPITPVSDIISASKICSSATIADMAKKLVSFHSPKPIDYRAKFGLSPRISLSSQAGTSPVRPDSGPMKISGYFCFKCQKQISEKEANFCWSNKSNKAKFGGRAYCYECQKRFQVQA